MTGGHGHSWWTVALSGDGADRVGTKVNVRADSWYQALQQGVVELGAARVGAVTNVSCTTEANGRVVVRDLLSGVVFELWPEEPASSVAQTTGEMVDCVVLTDEAATRADGVIYWVHQVLGVTEDVSLKTARQLARARIEMIRDGYDGKSGALYAVVDVKVDQTVGPVLSTAVFKAWEGRVIVGSAAEVPIPEAVVDQVPTVAAAAPIDLVARVDDSQPILLIERKTDDQCDAVNGKSVAPVHVQVDAAESAKSMAKKSRKRKRKSKKANGSKQANASPAVKSTKPVAKKGGAECKPAGERLKDTSIRERAKTAVASIEDGVMEAFLHMQGMYNLNRHDQVADFALGVGRTLIPCDYGVFFLIAPGQYELYAAAQFGLEKDIPRQRRFSMRRGIIGHTTAHGLVINLDNPAADERYVDEVDKINGAVPGRVLTAPVSHEGHNFGVIALYGHDSAGGFDRAAGNTLSYIAASCGEYIAISLPSREAEFKEYEFQEEASPAVKKQ